MSTQDTAAPPGERARTWPRCPRPLTGSDDLLALRDALLEVLGVQLESVFSYTLNGNLLRGPARVRLRTIVWWGMRQPRAGGIRPSYQEIAAATTGRDHTTVLRVQRAVDEDDELAADANRTLRAALALLAKRAASTRSS